MRRKDKEIEITLSIWTNLFTIKKFNRKKELPNINYKLHKNNKRRNNKIQNLTFKQERKTNYTAPS
jgi:hypothetical protein